MSVRNQSRGWVKSIAIRRAGPPSGEVDPIGEVLDHRMSSTRSDRCQRAAAAVLEPSGNIAHSSSTGTGATTAAVIAVVVSAVSNGYGADLASSPLRTDADRSLHISADVAAGVR